MVGHGSGGMLLLPAAQKSSTFSLSGDSGGYDAVRRHAATWNREGRAASAAALALLALVPGEACQFDRSHEIVLIYGVTTTVKVARVRLRHTCMLFVRAYPSRLMILAAPEYGRLRAVFEPEQILGLRAHMKRRGEG